MENGCTKPAVVGAGLPLEALVPAQRNLEDVFMELTR